MISRLNELTKEDKEKIIALDPNNIIWFESMKTFVKPFYKYLKELDDAHYTALSNPIVNIIFIVLDIVVKTVLFHKDYVKFFQITGQRIVDLFDVDPF